MKNSTTVVMLVIFAVVLGVYGLAQWKQLPSRLERRERAQRIFREAAGVEENEIDRVKLELEGETLVFERRGKGWQMVEPIDVLAEPGAIDRIVGDVKDLDMKTGGVVELEGGVGLEEYGLEKPSATVTLFHGDDVVATLLRGDKLSINDSLTYVKSAGEDQYVFVVENHKINSLDKSKADLREKDLITIGQFDADYVQIAWADRQPIAAEKREGAWYLSSPLEDQADDSKVEDLIKDAGGIRVENNDDFVDDAVEDLSKYGLDPPELTLEVRKPAEDDSAQDEQEDREADDEPRQTEPVVEKVLIGKTVEGDDAKRYAMIDGQHYVVAVSAEAVAKLDKQPVDLRSRKLADVSPFNVDFVEIGRPEHNLVLAKKSNVWRIYQPEETAGDSTAISDFLEKLTKLEIQEFLDDADPSEFGIGDDSTTVSLWEDGVAEAPQTDGAFREVPTDENEDDGAQPTPSGEPERIKFGKHDQEAGRLYAQRGDATGVVAVGDEILETLEQGMLAFRDKKIFDFTALDIARLDVVRDGVSFPLEKEEAEDSEAETAASPFAASSGTWRMKAPVEAPANQNVVTDLASSLRNLRTPRYFAEKPGDLARYGLDDPALRVTVTMKADGDEQAEQRVLIIGKPVDEAADSSEFYAMVSGGNLVFAVEKRMVDLIRNELRDPEIFSFSTSDAKSLSLAFPDRSWSLTKQTIEGSDDERWKFEGEPPFELDASKVDELLSTLSSLKADRFARYEGGPTDEHGLATPAVTLKVTLDGNAEKTLTLGSATEGDARFAASPDLEGAVFVVSESALVEFVDDPNSLRAANPEQEGSDSESPAPETNNDNTPSPSSAPFQNEVPQQSPE